LVLFIYGNALVFERYLLLGRVALRPSEIMLQYRSELAAVSALLFNIMALVVVFGDLFSDEIYKVLVHAHVYLTYRFRLSLRAPLLTLWMALPLVMGPRPPKPVLGLIRRVVGVSLNERVDYDILTGNVDFEVLLQGENVGLLKLE
jgi:hypothetical protein